MLARPRKPGGPFAFGLLSSASNTFLALRILFRTPYLGCSRGIRTRHAGFSCRGALCRLDWTILCEVPLAYECIEEAHARDLELKGILDRIRRGEYCAPYSIENDILLCTPRHDKKTKIVVPQTLIPVITNYFHTPPAGGHLGIYKTLHKIRD